MSNKIHILIDDIRNLEGMDIICRTATMGKRTLAYFNGDVERAYFDHDLGEDESGYDVMKWAIACDVLPKQIQLVTSNPVGRQNMENLLLDNGYRKLNTINFKKD